MVLFRNSNGDIGVPPDPSVIPDGCTAFTVDNLRDADRVAAEMTSQLRKSWSDDGDFTRRMDAEYGNPRSRLIEQMANPKTEFEREVIRGLISDLDKEEGDRERISGEVHFDWRER